MEQEKKKNNVLAISMIFLSLSAIFIVLAYGFGEAKQARYDAEWYQNETNFEKLASGLGYMIFKDEVKQQDNLPTFINITNLSI